MKLLLILLALSVGFHFCSSDSDEIITSPPPPPLLLPAPSPPPNPGFDYFVLSLTWPNAFCRYSENHCRPSPPKQQYFTIHGLWPQKDFQPVPLEF
ncbi:hypothetical protein L6164_028644 [Bauhinia variegata]|uniref:Uncharacterized protein n=1 Tax=Bauhinia variegata TaxID=167791 RepID=A0ACB9L6X9_BAUVA|nr:hypothetical protein L6164_028644 [Bauhinia variegata]